MSNSELKLDDIEGTIGTALHRLQAQLEILRRNPHHKYFILINGGKAGILRDEAIAKHDILYRNEVLCNYIKTYNPVSEIVVCVITNSGIVSTTVKIPDSAE